MVVIPEILVAAEHYLEVVPLVLIDPQARDVVRIAAVTEVAEVKAIEESSMVVQRPSNSACNRTIAARN